jgi:hypothetical protein
MTTSGRTPSLTHQKTAISFVFGTPRSDRACPNPKQITNQEYKRFWKGGRNLGIVVHLDFEARLEVYSTDYYFIHISFYWNWFLQCNVFLIDYAMYDTKLSSSTRC